MTKWRIAIEVEGPAEIEEDALAEIRIALSGAWEDSDGRRPFLECLCISLGEMIGAILKSGPVMVSSNEQMTEAFSQGLPED